MSASQWLAWRRYDAEYPIGGYRTEIEFARLKHLVSALVEGKKAPPIVDFMWSYILSDDERQTLEDQQVARRVIESFSQVR